MLSEPEKVFMSDFLKRMSLVDTLRLAKTATNGLIVVETRDDAIKVILQHHENVTSILNRKLVTKSVIFKYLHENGVTLSPDIDKFLLIQRLLSFWDSSKSKGSSDTHSTSLDNPQVLQQLSSQFSKWFYEKVNALVLKNGSEELEVSDFWPRSTATLQLMNGESVQSYKVEGAATIIQMYSSILNEHNLVFLPNVNPSGTKAKLDPHGLLAVMTCGSLHLQHGQVVGIFEQIFILAREPSSENNWKIQKTDAILKSIQGVTAPPELPPDHQYSIER